MELRSAFTRAIGWRWTPCVAPLLGSIAFVVFCITVVPDDIGPMSGPAPPSSERADSKAAAEPPTDTPSVEPTSTGAASRRSDRNAALQPRVTSRAKDTIQSFFRTPEALPVAPVDPDPGEPAAPPPPPPPTATVFTLPEPPPAAAPAAPAAPAAAAPPVADPSPPALAVPSSAEVPAAPNPDIALPR